MSEIRANTVSDAAGTGPVTLTGQYAAKAWANMNGTGTPSIRESGNVSSITDNGTGDYTVNFTTAMADANYSIAGAGGNNTTSMACVCQPYNLSAPTASAVRLQIVRADAVVDVDPPIFCVSIFR